MTDKDALAEQNRENAERTKLLDAESEQNLADRNRIWAAMLTAGFPAAEIAAPHGLSAQTVRWNVNRGGTPDARSGDRVGLRRGRKVAAKKAARK